MVTLSSLITTFLLLPMCECPNSRKLLLKSPIVFTPYNSTNQWWLNPDRWQKKLLRDTHRKQPKKLTVVISSFRLLISAFAVAAAVSEQRDLPQLNPTLAYYHTSLYRWILRQLSLYRDVINNVEDARELCRRRFYYENALVPQWIRKSLFWVDKTTWDKEEEMGQTFKNYSQRTFDQYVRFPAKKFVSNETFSNSTSIYYPGPFDN